MTPLRKAPFISQTLAAIQILDETQRQSGRSTLQLQSLNATDIFVAHDDRAAARFRRVLKDRECEAVVRHAHNPDQLFDMLRYISRHRGGRIVIDHNLEMILVLDCLKNLECLLTRVCTPLSPLEPESKVEQYRSPRSWE
ncbi:MAG: hypothetical protein ACAH80_08645 [Alphaproteobacteria bacterium]